ncbi:DUF4352 domain-containing protein [Candidatus Saccharibacteria bacterium]|nr:DUF4352 domain-containing protein [Candidatus Saccharibacteria bacterium]
MDNFGVATPPQPEGPRLDTNPQQPTFVDPNVAQVQGFASVPMTDPNAPQPMMQPAPAPMMPQMNQIDSILDPQPMQAAPAQGGGKGKKILLIVVMIFVFVGVGVGAYFVGFTAGKTAGRTEADAKYQAEQAALQEEDKDSDTSEKPEELDLSEPKDPDYTKDETLEGAIGEVLTASDGFVLRVNNIERNYKTDDPEYKADETKELVKVNFQIGNGTKSKTMDVNNTPFRLTDSTDAEVVPVTLADYEGKFDVTKLDPGAQSNASLVFAVTKDDKPLKFSRTQPYRISNQNREVTFKSIVTIAE